MKIGSPQTNITESHHTAFLISALLLFRQLQLRAITETQSCAHSCAKYSFTNLPLRHKRHSVLWLRAINLAGSSNPVHHIQVLKKRKLLLKLEIIIEKNITCWTCHEHMERLNHHVNVPVFSLPCPLVSFPILGPEHYIIWKGNEQYTGFLDLLIA